MATIRVNGVKMKVGDLCKIYRQDVLRITQTQMAELFGIKQPNIAAFENNREFWTPMLSRYFDMGMGNWLKTMTTAQSKLLGDIVNSNRDYMLDAESSLAMMRRYPING